MKENRNTQKRIFTILNIKMETKIKFVRPTGDHLSVTWVMAMTLFLLVWQNSDRRHNIYTYIYIYILSRILNSKTSAKV